MLLAHYHHVFTYDFLKTNECWNTVFAWLNESGRTAAPGKHEIVGRDIYANVIDQVTEPTNQRRFEVHRRYIDFQYCIKGGEEILWRPSGFLTETEPYDEAEDVQLFGPASEYPHSTRLVMSPDMFAIFFPQDAHAPMIQDGVHDSVRKVVVKIKVGLLK